MLHVVFVRSTRAHARLIKVDIEAASKMPGVVTIVTGEMIRDEINPLPQPSVTPKLAAQNPRFWPLAVDKVKFHGEPVAAVVATDRYLAEDAAEAVEVDYEDLPYIGDPAQALADDTSRVHDELKNNESFSLTFSAGRLPEAQKQHLDAVEQAFKRHPIASPSATTCIAAEPCRSNRAARSRHGTTAMALPPGLPRSDLTAIGSGWRRYLDCRLKRCG